MVVTWRGELQRTGQIKAQVHCKQGMFFSGSDLFWGHFAQAEECDNVIMGVW